MCTYLSSFSCRFGRPLSYVSVVHTYELWSRYFFFNPTSVQLYFKVLAFVFRIGCGTLPVLFLRVLQFKRHGEKSSESKIFLTSTLLFPSFSFVSSIFPLDHEQPPKKKPKNIYNNRHIAVWYYHRTDRSSQFLNCNDDTPRFIYNFHCLFEMFHDHFDDRTMDCV